MVFASARGEPCWEAQAPRAGLGRDARPPEPTLMFPAAMPACTALAPVEIWPEDIWVEREAAVSAAALRPALRSGRRAHGPTPPRSRRGSGLTWPLGRDACNVGARAVRRRDVARHG